jgi:tetratricopeptide (TPR) repeat protein
MAENPRIEELKRRVQVDPASIAFAALAEEYRRAGRYEEAIATCRSGLQRHPAYLSARVTLGRSLLELGQFVEAREELEQVLRAAPENLAAIRGLAEIHDRRGELPEALEHYRSALSVAKSDSELETNVDELSKHVAPPEPESVSAPEPVPMPSPPVTPTISLASSTPSIGTPKPPVKPPLELVTWVRADAESSSPAFAPDRGEESQPDPTVAALEDFLAAILKERDRLSAGADPR